MDWVMRAEGVSFRHAVELLRGGPSGEARPAEAREPESTGAKRPGLLEAGQDDQVLLRQVVDYYHATLQQSPEALEYL